MSIEKLKNFQNFVTIRGTLISLEKREGTYKESGTQWLNLQGVIQYGDSAVEVVKFKSQASATKSDGTESKAYVNLLNWAETAVPKTQNPDNPTMVTAYGSINHNIYYSNTRDNVIDGTVITINSFKEYEEPLPDLEGSLPDLASMVVEGYVLNIREETKGEEKEPTGRLKFNLLGLNFKKEPVIIKNITVPEEYAEAFQNMFEDEERRTAEFGIAWCLHKGESRQITGGLGKARLTNGKDYNELVFTYCSEPYEEETDLITPEIRRELLAFHDNQIEIAKTQSEEKVPQPKKGVGKSTKKKTQDSEEFVEVDSPIEDEDMPF